MHAAAVALSERGAQVVLDESGENLIRRRREADGPGLPFIVEVQGVGNLMHELVHAIRAGRIDDDHGIDYGQIPFDLERAQHRALLWDELAACVVSCAYLRAPMPEVDAWFAEQVETQPVFYGMDDEPDRFAVALEHVLASPAELAGLAGVLTAAYRETGAWLESAGAAPEVVAPVRTLDFEPLWRRYRGNPDEGRSEPRFTRD